MHEPSGCDWEVAGRSAAVRIEPAPRAPREPRDLRPGTHRRGDRRERDAGLPDAALHRGAESLPRVAAARPAEPRRRRGRPGRRVRRLRMEPGADLCLGHQCVAAAGSRCFSGWSSRASRSGPRSRAVRSNFRVFFMSDRGGIYALGYPVITPFGHLMNVAELIFLAGVLYLALVLGGDAHQRPDVAHTGQRPRPAARDSRQLLSQAVSGVRGRRRGAGGDSGDRDPRPISRRSSAPASKKRRRRPRWSRSGWSKTMRRCSSAAPARWRRSTIRSWCSSGAPSIRTSTSSSGPQLQATSERDLFASGLLPRRTPGRRVSPHRARPAADLRRREQEARLSAGRRARPGRRRWKGS